MTERKKFILSYNRWDIVSTQRIFPDAIVLVHSEEQLHKYRENAELDGMEIINTGVEPGRTGGITRQQEWLFANAVEDGEWVLIADDDMPEIRGVTGRYYNMESLPVTNGNKRFWSSVFAETISRSAFADIVEEMIERAETIGANLCGFSAVENYFFQGKKWLEAGYVAGKLKIVKAGSMTWDHSIGMEDYWHTADQLERYGTVLINKYIFPDAGKYIRGGMGFYNERLDDRKRDCKALVNRFDGLLGYRQRTKFEENTDLQVLLHSRAQVEKWRAMRMRGTVETGKP